MVDVQFHPEAEDEYRGALIWYQARSPQAATRFEAEVERVLNMVVTSPGATSKYDDQHRFAMLRRFPFCIVLQVQPGFDPDCCFRPFAAFAGILARSGLARQCGGCGPMDCWQGDPIPACCVARFVVEQRGPGMEIRAATIDECSIVALAVDGFRDHWSLPPKLRPCDFAGTAEDLEALDYMNYEIGYPELGFAGAALVWGNVLAKTGPFRWHIEESLPGLVLRTGRDGGLLGTPVIWPCGRVYEREQFGILNFHWLTVQVTAECLAWGSLDVEDEARLLALVDQETRASYRKRFGGAIGQVQA